MANLRQIVLNGIAGAFVDVLATVPSRKVDVMEDEAAATTGIQVKSQLDNFTTINTFTFGSEPIAVPDPQRYPAIGRLLGLPAMNSVGNFNYHAADKILSLRGAGAGGTTVRVEEWE